MGKIIYIAGYGRSGSTILSIILGHHPEVINVGEVHHLLPEWSETKRPCACGRTYSCCRFWRDLFPESFPPRELVATIRKLEGLHFLPRLLLGWFSEADQQAYQQYHEKLFSYVRRVSGKNIIVDCSKSAWLTTGRFLALQHIVGEEVYVVHLVRDGGRTLESQVLRGKNSALEGNRPNPSASAFRTVLGWVLTNVSVSFLLRRLPSDHYMLLRYEDFVADPQNALSDIGRLCGIDFTEASEKVARQERFPVGHLVGGNRIRVAEKVKLRRNIQRDRDSQLRSWDRVLFAVMGRWLNQHYGYT